MSTKIVTNMMQTNTKTGWWWDRLPFLVVVKSQFCREERLAAEVSLKMCNTYLQTTKDFGLFNTHNKQLLFLENKWKLNPRLNWFHTCFLLDLQAQIKLTYTNSISKYKSILQIWADESIQQDRLSEYHFEMFDSTFQFIKLKPGRGGDIEVVLIR